MKKLREMKKNQKGFTLVEVIVVLVILAIMAAILIPSLIGYIDKARENAIISETRMIVQAVQAEVDTGYGIKEGVTSYEIDTTATRTTIDGTVVKIAKTALDKLTENESITYTIDNKTEADKPAKESITAPGANKATITMCGNKLLSVVYQDGSGHACRYYDGSYEAIDVA